MSVKIVSVVLAVTTGLSVLGGVSECSDGNDRNVPKPGATDKGNGSGMNTSTQGVCNDVYRFRASGSLFKQERRNEVYDKSKLSDNRGIRASVERLHLASSIEGTPAQQAEVDKLAEQILQQCKAAGWKLSK